MTRRLCLDIVFGSLQPIIITIMNQSLRTAAKSDRWHAYHYRYNI